jgi:hypothetical protein
MWLKINLNIPIITINVNEVCFPVKTVLDRSVLKIQLCHLWEQHKKYKKGERKRERRERECEKREKKNISGKHYSKKLAELY